MLQIKLNAHINLQHFPKCVAEELQGWPNTHDVAVECRQGYSLDFKRHRLTNTYASINEK